MNLQLVKRFLFGMAVGLFVAIILWSYSMFFYVAISITQGVIGSLLLVVCCGIIATFSSIDKLMDNLNLPL
ncbi:MAG: hypothetical protein AAF298_28440 [Cyanobacteria bacterium P01_A01_bin.40]